MKSIDKEVLRVLEDAIIEAQTQQRVRDLTLRRKMFELAVFRLYIGQKKLCRLAACQIPLGVDFMSFLKDMGL